MSSILLVCLLALPCALGNPASWDISMTGAVVDGLLSFSALSGASLPYNLHGATTSLTQLFMGEWWQSTCSASMSQAPSPSPMLTLDPLASSSSASYPSSGSNPSFDPLSTLSSSPLPSFTPMTPSSFPSPVPVVPPPPNITAILLTLSNINTINIFLAFSQAVETRGIVLSQLILALLTTLAAPPVRRMEWSGGGEPRLLDTLPLVSADVMEILGSQYLQLNLTAPLLLQELQRQLTQAIYGNNEVVKLLLILSGQSYSLSLTPPSPISDPPLGRRGRVLQGGSPSSSSPSGQLPLSLLMDPPPPGGSPYGFTLRASFPPSTPVFWWDTTNVGGYDFGLSSFGNGIYSTARVQRILALFTLMLPVSLDAQAAAQVVVRIVIQINSLLEGLGLTADGLLGYVVGPTGGAARILQPAFLPGDSLYTLLVKLVAAIELTQAKIMQLAVLQKQVLEAALCGVWAV